MLNWIKAFIFLLLIFAATLWGNAKATSAQHANIYAFVESDSIINVYLKDTLNASGKIRELITLAERDITRQNIPEAIMKFQMALNLEPYTKDSFQVVALLYKHFSSLLFRAGNLELAAKYGKYSLYNYKRFDSLPSGKAYNLLGIIAGFYLRTRQYDSALVYYDRSLAEAKGTGDTIWIAAAYNNIGYLYYQSGKASQALSNFQLSLSMIRPGLRGDSTLCYSIKDNIGLVCLDSKDYDKALTLFTDNVIRYDQQGDVDGKIKSLGRVAGILLATGRTNEALAKITELEKLIPSISTTNAQVMLLDMDLRSEYARKTGNWSGALKYQKRISEIKDSIDESGKIILNDALQALSVSENRKFRKEMELNLVQLQQEKDEAQKNRILVIMSIIIILLLAAYLINRTNIQKKRFELQKAENELTQQNLRYRQLEMEKLEQELKYKKGDLSDLSIYLSNMKEIYDGLISKLNEISTKKPTEQKEHIGQMIKDIEAQIHSGEKLGLIQENIEQVNKEYYNKLLNQYPDLTKSEIELCGLLKLNMSNKEIAALKNISAESVKMARYRLRKKLNMSPDEDIYRFLAEI